MPEALPASDRQRCTWCGTDPLYVRYHDQEWGVPETNDQRLFEMLILEGAQAGLSWITILRKRDNYRKLFAEFDPNAVARFDQRKIDRLLQDPGIVRNRLKVESAVRNARAFLSMQEQHSSFSDWLWAFVDHEPKRNQFRANQDIPPRTALSDKVSKELKAAGFNFVGSTIVYAFMQAVGMVDDHLLSCWKREGKT